MQYMYDSMYAQKVIRGYAQGVASRDYLIFLGYLPCIIGQICALVQQTD